MSKRTTRPTKKPWTIAIYMAGDNDLDNNAYADLGEMKRIGTNANINIVAQLDSAKQGSKTTRYVLSKGTKSTLKKDAREKLGVQNTGDPRSLIDFVTWVAKNFPAERYALVLWNHGQGWDDTDIFADVRGRERRLPRSNAFRHALFRTSVVHAARLTKTGQPSSRAILIDDNAKDFLDNIELQKVTRAAVKQFGGKIDLFGMDACLMNQFEVAYQLRAHAKFMVGSELTEPLDGWPYEQVLRRLSTKPSTTTRDWAAGIVTDYIASYGEDGEDVTQSAVDLAHVDEVAKAVDALGTALMAAMRNARHADNITLARRHVQHFDDNLNANVDLGHLCQLFLTSDLPSAVTHAATNVLEELKRYVVRSGATGNSVRNARGVSIYFPTDRISPLYTTNLDFGSRNAWTRFLNAFLPE